ncbi:DUF1931 family protein [Streptomyces sp. NBC_01167]|uniref:DUF1931 family protein n=1 Tax=Streptomyces sp. NBC_01167 TaxID=2903756 RepID=UPI0038691D47
MAVMSESRFERFFRLAADLDGNDLKRYSGFVEAKLYDLLLIAQAAAKANARDIVRPVGPASHQGPAGEQPPLPEDRPFSRGSPLTRLWTANPTRRPRQHVRRHRWSQPGPHSHVQDRLSPPSKTRRVTTGSRSGPFSISCSESGHQ